MDGGRQMQDQMDRFRIISNSRISKNQKNDIFALPRPIPNTHTFLPSLTSIPSSTSITKRSDFREDRVQWEMEQGRYRGAAGERRPSRGRVGSQGRMVWEWIEAPMTAGQVRLNDYIANHVQEVLESQHQMFDIKIALFGKDGKGKEDEMVVNGILDRFFERYNIYL